jgi:hypothetical protein
MNNELERNILRLFFKSVSAVKSLDNTISDSKIIRDTQKKLKIALRDVALKCTCSRRTWGGPCEVCQCSDREMVSLRNFFGVMRKAKKHNHTALQMQDFIENTKKDLK